MIRGMHAMFYSSQARELRAPEFDIQRRADCKIGLAGSGRTAGRRMRPATQQEEPPNEAQADEMA